MRARLDRMDTGDEFQFICDKKMADKMDRVITINGGEMMEKDVRSYGVVIQVKKVSPHRRTIFSRCNRPHS